MLKPADNDKITEENKKIQAVVAGHICFDVIPAFKKTDKTKPEEIMTPGKLINMGEARVSTGGPVSNTGVALSTLGIVTKLMGKVGNDFFGSGVLKLLKERNADDGMIVMDGEETSYTIVIVPPGIDRMFLHNPGANNTFCADDINYEIVSKARLFHFGYPPLMKRIFENDGGELLRIFKRVKELGVTTSLDMSYPDLNSESGELNWKKVLERVLPYVDIYVPSVEETMFMVDRDALRRLEKRAVDCKDPLQALDMNELQALGDILLSMGTKIAVIKCGIRGFYIRTRRREILTSMGGALPGDPDNWADRELIEESFRVDEVASAAGAGDNSIAGFLAAFLRGLSIEESIRTACAVGAQNVSVYDALSGVKSWEGTLAMIPGWKKNRDNIEGGYWRYDANKQIWIGKKDKCSECT